MRSSFALLALAAGALARPQAVTSEIAPTATAPAGCSSTYSGTFEITVVNATSSKKRSLAERDVLTLSLAGGVLTDAAGRTGYIASNYQFQFDAPPQAGAIYTAGFSVCGNKSLALGGSTVFYQCDSGSFYNLYDRSWAAQCSPIYLVALGGAAATEASDGQPAATTAVAVTQESDGQPAGTTVLPSLVVSQISDGQPQGPAATVAVVSQLTDGQPQAGSATAVAATSAVVAVSQLSDGQPQAITATAVATSVVVAVSELSDGQPQAITATAVATSAVVAVSEATDGQIVATTAPTTLVTPTAVVSQISDGQIQAVATNGTATVASATLAQFTGAAASPVLGLGAVAAGIIGAVAML